jgi:hypothetical protein
VWTPKRIMMLGCASGMFILVYILYGATAVGRIDSLPPLPDAYARPDPANQVEVILNRPRPMTRLEAKLRQAFGEECEELGRPIRLELNSKSMVLSAGDFKLADGPVCFSKLSVALFGKDRGDGRGLEINTLRADVAVLKFDRPVTNLSEMNGRKIMEARLTGHITIVNNRRTALRDDDLNVYIATGPLDYDATQRRITTHDDVKLTDWQTRPKPSDINGKGMEMDLLTDEESAQTAPNAGPGEPGGEGAASPALAAARSGQKSRGEGNITGVKRIVLLADVDMTLYMSRQAALLGSDKTPANQPPASKAPDNAAKTKICIRTPGRFQYDFGKDHDMARFDVPQGEAGQNSHSPQDVTVSRHHEELQMDDQLVCQHLELRLKRQDNQPAPAGKSPAGPGAPAAPRPAADNAGPEGSLEIETAHATAADNNVLITSDSERLGARCGDFFYDAVNKRTILKGDPEVEADRDESLIRARELQIEEKPGSAGDKPYQQVIAKGPGSIDLNNKTAHKVTNHAYWKDRLLSSRDGAFDLLVLTGSARFVDDEHEQSMSAETLKVWLLPAEPAKPGQPGQGADKPSPTGSNSAPDAQGRRPHHLEALGNVIAHSRELNIHDSARLAVRFKDVPPSLFARMVPRATGKAAPPTLVPAPGGSKAPADAPTKAPATPPSTMPSALPAPAASSAAVRREPPAPALRSEPPAPAAPPSTDKGSSRQQGPSPKPAGPAPGSALPMPEAPATPPVGQSVKPGAAPALFQSGLTSEQKANEPARPIDLSAGSIEAWVLRCGEKNALDHLWTEGRVKVHQDPAKPGEKGVVIEGDTLEMKCNRDGKDGNELEVHGDLAKLVMDKMYIIGPTVNIDQIDNKAWVRGAGAMQMDSNTNLQGEPINRTVPLVVTWTDKMFFNGVYAEFLGGIQAEQENARMACQNLQVYFDRPISLKEGNRSDQPAKVRNLIGDQDVRVEDCTRDTRGNYVKYQLLQGSVIQMNTVPRDEDDPRAATSPEANEVRLSGPGTVRLFQRGSANPVEPTARPSTPVASAGRPAAAPQSSGRPGQGGGPNDEMMLTYVSFLKRMDGSSKSNTVKFWEYVRVLHMPCNNPRIPIDLDAILARGLPERAMYLRCDQLKVNNQPEHGRPNQQMEAHGSVTVQAREFHASAEDMTYNEQKDQIIFIAGPYGTAKLSKIVPGRPPETLEGRKIIYIRSTGRAWVDGGETINSDPGQF